MIFNISRKIFTSQIKIFLFEYLVLNTIYEIFCKVWNFWHKVFKSRLSKFFKGCLPQNLLSLLLNTLSHLTRINVDCCYYCCEKYISIT